MTVKLGRIGAVVLTYNSSNELADCLACLKAQRDVDLRVIVVDNASIQADRAAMEKIFLQELPDGIISDASDASEELLDITSALFVRNQHNSGYSAGNNIGARLAVAAGCEAVLIVNPDVRISNSHYLSALWSSMEEFPKCFAASSRIIDLAGRDQHPLRETGFWEELLWIRQIGPKIFRPEPHISVPLNTEPVRAEKLHGCCLLIRGSFLEATGFLDENVFLYSEEPILAARIRHAGGEMMVFPKLEALHAHVASTKGNPSRRMLQFIKSRCYYIDAYTNYGHLRKAALRTSYGLLKLVHLIRSLYYKS